jgi:hypothetical protein
LLQLQLIVKGPMVRGLFEPTWIAANAVVAGLHLDYFDGTNLDSPPMEVLWLLATRADNGRNKVFTEALTTA